MGGATSFGYLLKCVVRQSTARTARVLLLMISALFILFQLALMIRMPSLCRHNLQIGQETMVAPPTQAVAAFQSLSSLISRTEADHHVSSALGCDMHRTVAEALWS